MCGCVSSAVLVPLRGAAWNSTQNLLLEPRPVTDSVCLFVVCLSVHASLRRTLLVLLLNALLLCLSVVCPSTVALRCLLCHGAERRQRRARGLTVRHPDPTGTGRSLRVSVSVSQ